MIYFAGLLPDFACFPPAANLCSVYFLVSFPRPSAEGGLIDEGLWRTAGTLRLDYHHLKKRVDAATAQACADKPGKLKPTFVELAPSLVATPGKCMIELEQGDGSRMRIHLEGCQAPDLVALCNSFWSDLG